MGKPNLLFHIGKHIPTDDELQRIRFDVEAALDTSTGAKVVILSTANTLGPEMAYRVREQLQAAMIDVENPPRFVVVEGMQVTVIGHDGA